MKNRMLLSLLAAIAGMAITAFDHKPLPAAVILQWADTTLYPEEKHFSNIQQLTFGGDYAEAYFS